MRIERVVLKNVRALKDRDDRLEDADGVWGSACVRGLNGSGKTTWLEVIADLWVWFRRCTMKGGFDTPSSSLLTESSYASILVADAPEGSPLSRFWVAFGTSEELARHADELTGDCGPFLSSGSVPKLTEARAGRPKWRRDLLEWWARQFARAEDGKLALPNIVFIEAERKYVPEHRPRDVTDPRPTPAWQPVPRYLAEARGQSHLESILRGIRLSRQREWDLLRAWVAQLLPGVRLLDEFDEATQRPILALDTGELLTVDRLSAGERMLLINMGMVLRWLTPGGILLLDEPELHQHLSLMRGSLMTLERLVVRDWGGQLIVASHAPEVWNHFRAREAYVELRRGRP